jgi:hypothetical protein
LVGADEDVLGAVGELAADDRGPPEAETALVSAGDDLDDEGAKAMDTFEALWTVEVVDDALTLGTGEVTLA